MSLRHWRARPDWTSRADQMVTRSVGDWRTILATQTDGSATEFAARIFGDLYCYSAERKHETRREFYKDVHELAAALDAYAAEKGGSFDH